LFYRKPAAGEIGLNHEAAGTAAMRLLVPLPHRADRPDAENDAATEGDRQTFTA
jgi:hypothetical protein